jgi:acyl-CoA synthetase (NDP forming)/GNAT superfamily N-acetyltransferase
MTAQIPDIDVDALLVDAGIARIRTVRPADAAALGCMYDRASVDSLNMRFFSVSDINTRRDVERMTRPASDDHGSLLAQVGDEVVGVASFERLDDDPTVAEFAVLVDDAEHGRGIGMLLLEHLSALATLGGVTRFVAEVLPSNAPMLHLFRDAGLPMAKQTGTNVVHVELPLQFDVYFRRAVGTREALADAKSLARILAPASLVVVGAGIDPAGVGHQVLANVVRSGYRGVLHAVNRSGHRVAGVRAHRSLAEVPSPVDVVVVAVPAGEVLGVVNEAAACGAAGVVVVAAGFAELGAAGQLRQDELVRACRSAGMRLIGPNCSGIANANPAVALNATLSPTMPPPGGIGLMAQSGAVGTAALAYAARIGVGISSFISAGNKADVSGNDLLCAWEADSATRVCALYLESLGNPRKFARIAARVGRTKPVVVVKSGRSGLAGHVNASRLATTATADIAADTLFEQAGVTRVESLAELFDVATLFDLAPLPSGRRVAIVANGAGPGLLAADACVAAGLDVVALGDVTRRRLAGLLQAGGAISNPVKLDAAADPVSFEAALRVLLDDGDVDAVIAVYAPVQSGFGGGFARAITTVRADVDTKPVLACFLGVVDAPAELRSSSGRLLAPYFAFPEPAAKALGAAVRYATWRQRPSGSEREFHDLNVTSARAIVSKALSGGVADCWLDAKDAAALVASYGVTVAPSVLVRSAADAASAASSLGYPVALKVAAGAVTDKSGRGGVQLNLGSAAEVAAAYEAMEDRLGDVMINAIVQSMVTPGIETAISVVADSRFGPVVTVGCGGMLGDLIADRASHLLPMTAQDAARQIRSLRTAPLLLGYRGTPPSDVGALEEMVLRVAALATNIPELAELDMDPVMVNSHGAIAVDVKVRLQPAPAPSDPLSRNLRLGAFRDLKGHAGRWS